jgi:large subunit ribosomal protein L18
MNKNRCARHRRIRRSRAKLAELNVVYLSVYRSAQHIYAQVFSPRGATVLASASSLDPTLRNKKVGNKRKMAEAVGELIAARAKAKGITGAAFDRSGYRYHGRVRELAEAARAGGLIT